MSVYSGANVVDSGLVFHMDMNNTEKSWKGAPTTNLYGTIDQGNIRPTSGTHYWDGNFWLTTGGYTDPGIPGPIGIFLGKTYTFKSGALNSTWSGNSYGYMLRTMGTVNAQYYALSCYLYVSPDCNIDYFGTSIEGASAVAISGFPTTYNLAAKGTWQRQALSGIGNGGNFNFIPTYPSKYGVTDGSFTGLFMFAMPMVETNTYPSYPTVGTRSNTQAIMDLTKNNTVTTTSLTYNSDGTFSFTTSSTNFLTIPTSTVFDTQTLTMESWCKPTVTAQSGFLFEKGVVNTQYSNFFNSDGTFYFRTIGLSSTDLTFTTSTYITAAQWNHIVCTYAAGTKTVYINGTQRYQITGLTGTIPTGQVNQYIGAFGPGTNYFFNGSIGVSRFYNRALTAVEVKQNFEATRNRYSI